MGNKIKICSFHRNPLVYLVQIRLAIFSNHLNQTVNRQQANSFKHLNPMAPLQLIISFKHLNLMVYSRSLPSPLKTQLVCLELKQDKTLSLAYSKPPKIL